MNEKLYLSIASECILCIVIRIQLTKIFRTQIMNYPNCMRASNLIGVKRLESVVDTYMEHLLFAEERNCNKFET